MRTAACCMVAALALSAAALAQDETGVVATNVVTVTVTATNYVDEVVKDPKVHATTNLVTRLFHLHNASSDEVAEKFNAMWSGDFGAMWKISKMAQSFPEANAVMVTAPSAVIDACDAMGKAIDVEPKQVYI